LESQPFKFKDLVENHRIPPKYYYEIKSRQFQQKSKSSTKKTNSGTLMVQKGLVKAIPVAIGTIVIYLFI
jgi:hypothetical protein